MDHDRIKDTKEQDNTKNINNNQKTQEKQEKNENSNKEGTENINIKENKIKEEEERKNVVEELKNKYQYMDEVKITKERIPIIIGKKGSTKKEIEELTRSKILVDSKEGYVKFFSNDPIIMLQLRDIIKAIGRGFNPKIALNLLKSDYVLEIIDVTDFGKTKKARIRLKGRVIGEKGKARRTIENLTETDISVYGKTVSIIGEVERVSLAKRAVISLLSGSSHGKVYAWLEKKRKEIKYRDMLLSWNNSEIKDEIKDKFKDQLNSLDF